MPNLIHYLPDPYTLRTMLFAATFLGLISLYIRIAQSRIDRRGEALVAETAPSTPRAE
jgi:hypothetical protein